MRAAQDFAIEVAKALDKIQDNPERFARISLKLRACSVTRFPYQVIFRLDSDRIYVIAVTHAKRRPNYWRRRT